MNTVKISANYSRIHDVFPLGIKKGSSEEIEFFPNGEDVVKYVKKELSIDISYNFQNRRFNIPSENQYDI